MKIAPDGSTHPLPTSALKKATKPVVPVTVVASRKSGANGNLSYTYHGKTHSFDLWIIDVTQPHELDGQTVQAKMSNHFYPKSYMSGDITMTIVCPTQTDFQALGRFIRNHHLMLMEHSGGFDVQRARNNESSTALKKLMQLQIGSEAIVARGIIQNFHLTRKGVFEQAPVYPLVFMPLWDKRSPNFKVGEGIRSIYPKKSDEVGFTNTPHAKKIAVSTQHPTTPAGQPQSFQDNRDAQ